MVFCAGQSSAYTHATGLGRMIDFGGFMTPEQDKAMVAVLKAVAVARKTGLTEKQIIDRIERTKPVEFRSGSATLAGDDAGWNPLTEDLEKPKQ